MMKIFSLSRYGGKVFGLLLLALFLFATAKMEALVSRPQAPILSLTADKEGYDNTIYPDGRLWIPPSASAQREILVPVFIQNNFFTFDAKEYIVPPIYSFRFSMFYDAAAVQCVGVELVHPKYMEDVLGLNGSIDEDPPFANGWNVNWNDKVDLNFWKYIDANTWAQIKDAPGSQVKRGRRVTFDGTCTMPMRHNDKNLTDQWNVLLYVRFKIIGDQNIGDPNTTYLQTPMYVAPDEILYNGLDITKELVYKGFSHIYKNPASDYPALPQYPGLGGLDNSQSIEPDLFLKEPYRPGSIMVRISNGEPEFWFPSDANEGFSVNRVNNGEWELEQVITVDSNNVSNPNGIMKLILSDNIERSRLNWIEIESDEPWLLTTTTKDNTPRRYRSVSYIDNDILGILKDPNGDVTVDDGTFNFTVVCDPTKLKLNDPSDPEKTGIHVGYITFKSPVAKYNNVRLKIRFIYIRTPWEPKGPNNAEGYAGGIFLNLRNSRGNTGDNTTLVFGTGHRGTPGVDSLFGEYHPSRGLLDDAFDARFFPYPPVYPDQAAAFPNGFGDFSPNQRTPRTASRDIRDYNYNGSHIYYVKFNAGGDGNYPVVLNWDTRQFPAGARVFLRDTLNGQLFQPIDMRTGTPMDGQGFVRSFTFQDASINSFIIEYTLPKDIKYVDQDGNPIIKKGWNLLSLPVRPVNSKWNLYYPNAINTPFYFSQNQYQSEENLRAGVGYFIKYSDSVDKFFTGTEIRDIQYPNDLIKVYPGDVPDPEDPATSGGWNAIGACSIPVNVTDINFSQFQTSPVPSPAYTLKFGVWQYKTDNGYKEVSQLLPGLGYWIKVNSTGYLKLIAPWTPTKSSFNLPLYTKAEILASTAKLSINDDAQHSSELYFTSNNQVKVNQFEMPPAPPAGLYDARFANNLYLSNANQSVVKLQGVTYPVLFSMENADAQYTLTDAISGQVLGTINKDNKNVTINKLTNNAVKIEKVNFVNGLAVSVYPNPVIASSNVDFAVTENGNVTLKLYNEVGTEIMTLVNADYTAGTYSVQLDAANLATGSYLLKLSNGSNFQVVKVNVVK